MESSFDNLINKDIIYKDNILPLRGKLKNLNVFCINNVLEKNLDNYIKIILESNPGVIFHCIQYSKIMRKVYFYADSKVSFSAYEDSKKFNYKDISSNKDVLEEVKNVLLMDDNFDNTNISLYDLFVFYKEKNEKFDNILKKYEQRLNYILNNECFLGKLIIYGYDYDSRELRIGIKYRNEYKKISFCKKNGDIFVKKNEIGDIKRLYTLLCNEISMICDEYEYYREFKEKYALGIKASNSNFLVNVSSNEVGVYVNKRFNNINKLFGLSFYCYKTHDGRKFNYECGYFDILTCVGGHEVELFKKIYVNIISCPTWSRNELYNYRTKQLYDEQKNYENEIRKERHKEKVRKLNPFRKK